MVPCCTTRHKNGSVNALLMRHYTLSIHVLWNVSGLHGTMCAIMLRYLWQKAMVKQPDTGRSRADALHASQVFRETRAEAYWPDSRVPVQPLTVAHRLGARSAPDAVAIVGDIGTSQPARRLCISDEVQVAKPSAWPPIPAALPPGCSENARHALSARALQEARWPPVMAASRSLDTPGKPSDQRSERGGCPATPPKQPRCGDSYYLTWKSANKEE